MRNRLTTLFIVIFSILLTTATAFGQTNEDALFKDFKWRNIGPANMAGRVVDIEAVVGNPAHVYVASASGGVFKSINSGTTWESVFDNYSTGNIGDLAIFQPNPDIVWVGTGEANTRNSVGWGDGVYKSTDGGKTFTNMGLKDSHHIGAVVAHPTDADIVYVASQGHLWGHRGDKGLFKTTDGGHTWDHLTNGLPNDGKTGASDLVMDPNNSNILYAGFWERLRQPYRFDSGGQNGGIFKSTDGGESWNKLTNGLPEGDTGKIGIDVYRKNPNIVMAIVEHGFQPPARVDSKPNPDFEDMSKLGTGIYRSEDGGATWAFVNRYNYRPFYYSKIWINPSDDQRVYLLVGSGNVSLDGGKTFAYTMDGISGDFHALWIDPNNKDFFYVGNDKGSYKTYDHGKTFTMYDNMAIGQFYAANVDNRDPYYVYGGLQDNGNWGAPSNSRDWNGILNDHWFKFHSGDGFHTTPDPNDWKTVYTESQGGNIRRLDAKFRSVGKSITPETKNIINIADIYPDLLDSSSTRLPRDRFRFNWSTPLILSPHNSKTIYFGGNHIFKSLDRGDSWSIISPDISKNDPVMTDPESGGITRDVTSAETHGTAITIMESPITPGIIWVGTDDGNIQLTMNDGKSWIDVRKNIKNVPKELWVSRVEPSHFEEGTAYISFDGHRSDNFKPWVFKTTDFGKSWENISSNLPDGWPVYVVKEDLKNKNLLYAGTEQAAYASVNGGDSWARLMSDMPSVAVHDLVIHPRDGDLIAATHGRSIWILDDITPLQQFNDDIKNAAFHLFDSKIATQWKGSSRGATRGHFLFMGRNPLTMSQVEPGNSPREIENSAAIHFYLKNEPTDGIAIEITDMSGEKIFHNEIEGTVGINRYFWKMRFNPPKLTDEERAERQSRMRFGRFVNRGETAGPGTYIIKMTYNSKTYTSTVTVRQDPGLER